MDSVILLLSYFKKIASSGLIRLSSNILTGLAGIISSITVRTFQIANIIRLVVNSLK